MRFIGTVVSYFANTEVQRGKDNYDIPQIDSYAEQKIVMNKLESGEFLCYLHGNYNEQIKAALSDLTTGRVRDALQHLKSIRPEVWSIGEKASEALDDIRNQLAKILLQKAHNEVNNHELFNAKMVVKYLNEVDQLVSGLNREKKYKYIMREFYAYMNERIIPTHMLKIYSNSYHLYTQYHIMGRYLKSFMRQYEPLFQEALSPDFISMIPQLEKLHVKYPLAKKKIFEDRYFAEKLEDFRSELFEHVYDTFHSAAMEGIVDGSPYKIEHFVAHFIHFVHYATHLTKGELNNDFLEKLLEEETERLQREHYHRVIQEARKVEQHKLPMHAVKNENHDDALPSLRKEVPHDVMLFIDRLSELAPDSVVEDLKRYIVRVYRKSKPLSAYHLVHDFGIGEEYIPRIIDLAAAVKIDVSPLHSKENSNVKNENLEILVEALNAPHNGYTQLLPPEPEEWQIPHTAQGIMDLISRSWFHFLHERKLLKNLRSLLIEWDPEKTIIKKLVTSLESMRFVWHFKKWGKKIKALELSGSYRFVVQHINHKDCVVWVLDHEEYDKFLRESLGG